MQTVLTTSTFDRQARAIALTDDEVTAMASAIGAEPTSGDVMQGTGGARKLRFPRPGGGKSGGYRTVHYFGGDDVPVFLLAVLDKGQRANLSKAERNELADVLSTIADDYRAGVARRVVEMRGKT